MAPPIFRIAVLVETADSAVLDRLADDIAELLCSDTSDDPEHRCPVPWFITTSPLGRKKSRFWRQELNR